MWWEEQVGLAVLCGRSVSTEAVHADACSAAISNNISNTASRSYAVDIFQGFNYSEMNKRTFGNATVNNDNNVALYTTKINDDAVHPFGWQIWS